MEVLSMSQLMECIIDAIILPTDQARDSTAHGWENGGIRGVATSRSPKFKNRWRERPSEIFDGSHGGIKIYLFNSSKTVASQIMCVGPLLDRQNLSYRDNAINALGKEFY